MNKIVVAHIITKLELGGAQINTLYTCENLNRQGFEVFLVSGKGGLLTPSALPEENFLIVNPLVREINPFKDPLALYRLIAVLKSIKPRIVHTHSSKAGILGRLAARFLNIPVIIHSVHGFSFSRFQPFLKRKLFETAERMVSGYTSHFVFVSKGDIAIGREKGLIRDNYSLIRSGFPMKGFLAEGGNQKQTREKYSIDESQVVCGVIAPFKPQKGLFHLLKIAHRVLERDRSIVFFIAGDGRLRKALEWEMRRKGIFENFRLPGFIFDVERVIDIFDIGISTALWEGLPQALVQMRLKGKPVVASDIPGNREIIVDGKNGYLVEVTDTEKFAEKILTLAAEPAHRRYLGKFSGEDFSSWDADFMTRQQEELYMKLLGKSSNH